ncbi:MAG TPA: molybdenum ABC transporter permease [Acetomicrobium flavidum]|uniref:ABC-type molybdate transport system, permease component n=1 Tax=Acetomicrobium mobile (strain ATCC BAA-54 / DSM 13181 / JCM 12221 / NGA) TaxID=891968 RepID=I4BU94_ACEMN|nr:molybdenum ABC transporter permease [Acetomicrobium mobile]NLG94932.1 molybdenum ABC transporter permease [Acetomicrobium flavidum]AFM20851.1 ABC-type molybdate transport system, permease component [Acetomicrobium mobile DSM 13181]HOJ82481.1 molybdenum ABC transporter permease [Acetomicrobium flavidum]HOM31493.1 molybdenum ABC transporter permease [Acetomicrobium flavidum]HOP88280.1 molybdenum ABC transporter permease [Acetomicrobium flavidum]
MISSLIISLKVLAIDVPLLLIIGVALGWILAKTEFKGKDLLDVLVILPIALPPSVLGLYLLMTLSHIPFIREAEVLFSFPAAALAPLFPSLPIMIQAARSGFSSVDRQLEQAARTLGDSELKIFWRITFPLSRLSIMAGLALASMRALGDFGVTLMIAGNIPGRTQTLPLFIYSNVEAMNFLEANIAALLLTILGIASLLIVKKLEGRHIELS